MQTVTLEAREKSTNGTGSARQLRREGLVPCILYGRDINIPFSAPISAFNDLIYKPGLHKAVIKLGDKQYEAVVKEIQFHPVNDRLMHVDFEVLEPGKKITTQIPVTLTGRPAGIAMGGKLFTKMRKVTVKATPEHLIDFLEVDVSHLQINMSVRVSDLKALYPEMDFLQKGSTPVATVGTTRAAKALEAALEGTGEEEAGEAPAEEGGESSKGGEAAPEGQE